MVGTLGIVAPRVESAEEAAAIVRHCRFAPAGDRGVAATFPHFGMRPIALGDAVRELADATMVVVQIESKRGLANADLIAATAGVDVLLVGCTDLSVEIGKPAERAVFSPGHQGEMVIPDQKIGIGSDSTYR